MDKIGRNIRRSATPTTNPLPTFHFSTKNVLKSSLSKMPKVYLGRMWKAYRDCVARCCWSGPVQMPKIKRLSDWIWLDYQCKEPCALLCLWLQTTPHFCPCSKIASLFYQSGIDGIAITNLLFIMHHKWRIITASIASNWRIIIQLFMFSVILTRRLLKWLILTPV